MRDINLENPRNEIEETIAAGDLSKLLTLAGLLGGHYCPALALGVKAATRAARDLNVKYSTMPEEVAIVETHTCFADGVQFVTGCCFGNKGLIYRDYGKTAVTLAKRSGEAIRLSVKNERVEEESTPEIDEVTQRVIFERGGTEADRAKMSELMQELSFKILDVPDEEIFNITRFTFAVPGFPEPPTEVKCSICGEDVLESRIRMKDSKPVCIPCSGQQYYQVQVEGISVATES